MAESENTTTSIVLKRVELKELKRMSRAEGRTVSAYVRWLIQREIVRVGDPSILPVY